MKALLSAFLGSPDIAARPFGQDQSVVSVIDGDHVSPSILNQLPDGSISLSGIQVAVDILHCPNVYGHITLNAPVLV